jgi:hypothetical protein
MDVTRSELVRKDAHGREKQPCGPNSACDVGLPLELTSGLGRDRGESGGFGGVLVAPARRREKLGRLFIGIVGSGCTRSRIMRLGLVRVRTVDIKGTGGITG